MNIFKKFNIWWGWWLKKQKILGPFISFIVLLVAAVGVMIFVFSFFPIYKEEAMHIIVKARIIAGILAPIFLYLTFSESASGSHNNFRIAVDEAKKFIEEKQQNLTARGLSKINALIQKTEETKDPKKMNEWIEVFKALTSYEKEMEGLKEKMEFIEKGDALEEVKAKIRAKRKAIDELEAKLAY